MQHLVVSFPGCVFEASIFLEPGCTACFATEHAGKRGAYLMFTCRNRVHARHLANVFFTFGYVDGGLGMSAHKAGTRNDGSR